MLTNFEMICIILLVCSGYTLAIYFYMRGNQIVTDCNQVLQDVNDSKDTTNKHGRIDLYI